MRTNPLIALAVLAVFLTGCRSQPHMNPDFGYSVANNKAAQVVNPSAAAQDRADTMLDGQKAEKALDRYRKDRPDESRQKLVKDIN